MFGLDETVAELASSGGLVVLMGVAVLLGLRHATDPDHLTAVVLLMAGDRQRGTSLAMRLGLAWGMGHATTLMVLGLPIVLFDDFLPAVVQRTAEVLIGLVIALLAARLLLRWWRLGVHAHTHSHGEVEHRHVHVHEDGHAEGAEHQHRHPAGGGRSAAQAYGVGCLHGVGGSAGIGILLLAAIPSAVEGVIALGLFSLFTAVSMAIVSTGFGAAMGDQRLRSAGGRLTPALGMLSLGFGVWYALGAVEFVPYVF